MQIKTQVLFITIFYLLLCACNTTKQLADGDLLIIKNKIQVDNKQNLKESISIEAELFGVITPTVNSRWFKLPVWLYHRNKNRVSKDKKPQFERIAKMPSIFNEKEVEFNRLKMEKYLLDNGYIGSTVNTFTSVDNKKMKVLYKIKTQPIHIIHSLSLISDSTLVGRHLRKFEKYRVLKEGDPYNKSKIDEERAWYARTLRNDGFINITEDYFYFTVDTLSVNDMVNIGIHFKVPEDENVLKRYKIGNTYLNWKSETTLNENLINRDTQILKPGLISVGASQFMTPKLIDLTIDQDKGEYISEEKQELTLNHFLSYGLFKYINQKYSKPYGESLDTLDRYIELDYDFDGSLGLDFELNNRSGSFFGSGITGSFTNKNTFKGAEIFNVGLTFGAEVQFNQNQSFINSYIAELNTTLSIPQLLIPSFIKYKPSTFYIPRTFVEFKNSAQNRIESYSAVKSSLDIGYKWRETRKSNHEISVLSFNYLNIFNRSTIFEQIEANDRRIQLSLQDLFDIGIEYTYTFTNQNSKVKESYSFFSANVRTAGNTLGALIPNSNNTNQRTIFQTPFSQYAKILLDYRYFVPIRNSLLIGKIETGVAFAYGNSEQVPYDEQFVVGGSQSLRGFQLRGLGPGLFVIDTNTISNPVTNQFFDQTGDIILEMNLEHRFPIFGYLKGAAFIDAGNIWLIRDDPVKPGGLFQFNSFLEQIAINTGVGLRFDIQNFIVVRLDLGFLIRRPYENEGFEWTTSRSDAFSIPWVVDNRSFQLGLGYPF